MNTNHSLAARAYQVAYHDTPVREFHEAFGHPVSYDPKTVPDIATRVLRVKLIAEELIELTQAMGLKLFIDSAPLNSTTPQCYVTEGTGEYDPIETADATADIRYLVDGTNLVCGIPGELVLAEVHRSNMSKLGADGKPVLREDGKILKGPNYFKPDVAKVLFGGGQQL